jgi:hypothetical protein
VKRLLLVTLALALLAGPLVASAAAAGNASRAVGFIEAAQNRDGGFGAKRGGASDPLATLWASAALLAAGKNPRDEFLENGDSAEDYLVGHLGAFASSEELGLLALVQNASGLGASRFGRPVDKLASHLSQAEVKASPRGVALAIFGLLSARTESARRTANAAAQALLASTTSDGAWGPDGNADSTSTALVLQALAATGLGTRTTPQVKSGLAYLRAAQVNDGSIAESTRVDKATAGGSVAATAYTVQALAALRLPAIRTATGKSVAQGLVQYQQQTSGGLTSKGGIYSQVAPSVVETAQAFPALDGVSFVLRSVPSTSGGPDAARKRAAADERAKHDNTQRRESSGSGASGASGHASDGRMADPGAFKRAVAGGGKRAGRAGSSNGDAAARQGAASHQRASSSPAGSTTGGDQVSGAVVRAASGPALKTRAGADDRGLTNRQRATLLVGALIVLLALAGALLERRRPRPSSARPLATEGIAAAQRATRPVLGGAAVLAGVGVRDAASGRALVARRRWPLVLVLALGIGLVALPAATHMFERAPRGAQMVDAFAPYMRAERLAGFQRDVREVDAYANEALTRAPQIFVPGVADAQLRREQFLTQAPSVALFAQQWPAVNTTFTRLLGTIQRNKANYDAVAALPSFTLFPWFFVVPGVLLIVLALVALALGRRRPTAWIPLRRAAIALGVGLVLAPVAFQMFTRAPQGGRMVAAFKPIETRTAVQAVQGDFGTIAVGQGAIRTDLVPKLQARGWSDARLRRELPASMRLQERWTAILNDLTPMIGVMSDNVGNYKAVAALPPFALFPWLFVVPGLLLIALALVAGRRPAPPRVGVALAEREPSDDVQDREPAPEPIARVYSLDALDAS